MRAQISIVASILIAGHAAAQTAACTGTWSKPVSLTRDGSKPVYIERGIVTQFGGRAVAIGAPTLFWLASNQPVPQSWLTRDTTTKRTTADSADAIWSFSRGGAFIDSAGISAGIPMVDTATVRVSPRLFARNPKYIMAIWEAADSVVRGGLMNATRIETAAFDGTRWRANDVLLRGDHLGLGPIPAVRDGRVFDLATFAATSVDSSHTHVHVVRRHDGHLADVLIPDVSFGSFFGAYSPDTNRTLVIAMGAVVPGRSGLYAINGRWTGDSAVWSKPAMIDSFTGGYSTFAWARLGADSVALVWIEEGGPIKTSVSADGGATWTNTTPLESKGQIGSQVLAVDAAGRLHMVYDAARPQTANSPGAVLNSMWIDGRWTSPDTLITGDGGGPALGGIPGGRLMATWGEITSTPLGPSPRTFVSVWSPACASHR